MTTTVESLRHGAHGRRLLPQQPDDRFFLRPSGPNAIAPGKRPRSSMAPTIILHRDYSLAGAIGSPGGNAILAYVSKALVGIIDWKLPMDQAFALPIWSRAAAALRARPAASSPEQRAEMAKRGVEGPFGFGRGFGMSLAS